jgi:cytoskeletal protein RodZ
MRFSLRTLLIVMLLLGPLSAWGWAMFQARLAELERQRVTKAFSRPAPTVRIAPRSARFTLPEELLQSPTELIHLPADPYQAVTSQELVDEVTRPTEPTLPKTVAD